MTTFRHSGCLGDVIYSIPVIQRLGPGELQLIIGGVPAAIRKYNNGPVPAAYEGKISMREYLMLKPLLLEQPCITSLLDLNPNDDPVDVDLDKFRGTVGQSFTGNFLETYFKTFDLPYTPEDIITPWLTVPEPKRVAKFVISRTLRYRSNKVATIPTWINLLQEHNIAANAVFVGLPEEHKDFEELFNVKVPFYPVNDFLEMAEVIAGCDQFLGNQTFAYGLAQGLGKSTVLETLTWRPLHQNECFFPRSDCLYF